MAESQEVPKTLLIRAKEESERPAKDSNIKKTKIMESQPHYCMANKRGKGEVAQISSGLQNHCGR